MGAIWVISNGCRWRVGNGASVNMWSDKWMHLGPSLKVVSLVRNNDVNMKVVDLIDWEWYME